MPAYRCTFFAISFITRFLIELSLSHLLDDTCFFYLFSESREHSVEVLSVSRCHFWHNIFSCCKLKSVKSPHNLSLLTNSSRTLTALPNSSVAPWSYAYAANPSH